MDELSLAPILEADLDGALIDETNDLADPKARMREKVALAIAVAHRIGGRVLILSDFERVESRAAPRARLRRSALSGRADRAARCGGKIGDGCPPTKLLRCLSIFARERFAEQDFFDDGRTTLFAAFGLEALCSASNGEETIGAGELVRTCAEREKGDALHITRISVSKRVERGLFDQLGARRWLALQPPLGRTRRGPKEEVTMEPPSTDPQHLPKLNFGLSRALELEIQGGLEVVVERGRELGIGARSWPELRVRGAIVDDDADSFLRWNFEDRRSEKRNVHAAAFLADEVAGRPSTYARGKPHRWCRFHDIGDDEDMSDQPATLNLLLSAVHDASARPASLTRTHGDAMERLYRALGDTKASRIEIIELAIPHRTFALLREHLGIDPETVALYDIFPVSSRLDPSLYKLTGQFLAAEAIWTLEGQGQLGTAVLDVRVEVPEGWDRTPQELQKRLLQAGALEIEPQAIEAFKRVKASWDAMNTKA